jgi:hypothetical protein
MSISYRFGLDENREVTDALNSANSGMAYCHEGEPEDEKHLRERVLYVRLGEIIKKLIINSRPPSGEKYEPFNEKRIQQAIIDTIRASHLNSRDPALSIRHKFDGKLKRQKKHTQDITSVALFRDDVESLLRDLYGDIESEALDTLVLAVFCIVKQFAEYVRPDLCKEHFEAEEFDFFLGVGVPDGYGVGGSDWRRAMVAKIYLFRRVREVNANPSAFSEYTLEFAKLFADHWDCTNEGEWEKE